MIRVVSICAFLLSCSIESNKSLPVPNNLVPIQATIEGLLDNYVSEYQNLNSDSLKTECYSKHSIQPSTTLLRWNDALTKVAEAKALDRATRNYFAHVGPDGFGFNHFMVDGIGNWNKSLIDQEKAQIFNSAFAVNDTTLPKVKISSLRTGERYRAAVKSIGCFHTLTYLLTIGKRKDGYIANVRVNGKISGKKVKYRFSKRLISEIQIDSVIKFEQNLALIAGPEGRCTTVDVYRLSIGENQNLFEVSDCEWAGIYKLVGYLFIRPDKNFKSDETER